MLINSLSVSNTSTGPSVAGVNVLNRQISNIQQFIPCHSGVKLGADGVLSTISAFGGFSAVPGEWLITGSAAGFWVRRTLIDGALQVDPGGGFLQLNTDRIYDNIKLSQGVKNVVLFLEFSSDASGTPIVAAATFELTSEQSSFVGDVGDFF